jgi:DNA-binding CsgD family transcriptional regulator
VIARIERGQDPAAEPRLAEAEARFLAAGALPLLALVQQARGRLALASERYGEAYLRLARVFDPGDAAYHQFTGGGLLADLAEAAVHGGGDRDHVRAIIAPWARVATATNAAYLQVQLRFAEALLADDDQADRLFAVTMARSSAGWPYHRARAQLAYGRWLRRRRRSAQARPLLREAAETLDALGAVVLAGQARRELRASGETVPRRTALVWDQLSPQELQIAQLAARGLSNRQIGERLFSSPRTVATHVSHILAKLGVRTRTDIARVASRRTAASG